MNTEFCKLFLSLESERAELLQKISTVPAEKFFKQPKQGKWSIAEILTHVLTAERLSVIYLKKKSRGVDELSNVGLWEDFKYTLFQISEKLPLKLKAPTDVVKHTPVALDFNNLTASWNSSRKDLEVFLNSIAEKNVDKKVYKHAILGRVGVKHALLFFKTHVRHHIPQIDRIINS